MRERETRSAAGDSNPNPADERPQKVKWVGVGVLWCVESGQGGGNEARGDIQIVRKLLSAASGGKRGERIAGAAVPCLDECLVVAAMVKRSRPHIHTHTCRGRRYAHPHLHTRPHSLMICWYLDLTTQVNGSY